LTSYDFLNFFLKLLLKRGNSVITNYRELKEFKKIWPKWKRKTHKILYLLDSSRLYIQIIQATLIELSSNNLELSNYKLCKEEIHILLKQLWRSFAKIIKTSNYLPFTHQILVQDYPNKLQKKRKSITKKCDRFTIERPITWLPLLMNFE